jgi:mono/diheme cytochrome c family protein
MNTTLQQCVVAVGFLLGAAASATAEGQTGEGEVLFATRVYPVFESKCFACHGTEEIKGDFQLTSRATLLRGGESGEPAVRPGDPEASPLFRSITWADLEMPPKENDRLSEKQVAVGEALDSTGRTVGRGAAPKGTGRVSPRRLQGPRRAHVNVGRLERRVERAPLRSPGRLGLSACAQVAGSGARSSGRCISQQGHARQRRRCRRLPPIGVR